MGAFEDRKTWNLQQAEVHRKRAEYFAALNVAAVFATAGLAAVAAITSLATVPTWITTASAGLAAALAVITPSFNLRAKSVEHTDLAADRRRLDSLYGAFIAAGTRDEPSAEWSKHLAQIETSLNAHRPVRDEGKWAGATPPASAPV